MLPLSEFNTVLSQVLALTEATTTECGLLPPESVERYRCEGKLVALHQVIEFFLAIDSADSGRCRSTFRIMIERNSLQRPKFDSFY